MVAPFAVGYCSLTAIMQFSLANVPKSCVSVPPIPSPTLQSVCSSTVQISTLFCTVISNSNLKAGPHLEKFSRISPFDMVCPENIWKVNYSGYFKNALHEFSFKVYNILNASIMSV